MRKRLIGAGFAAALFVIAGFYVSRQAQQPAAAEPASSPSSARSAPDISGVWLERDLGDAFAKDAPPLQPWAIERTKANVDAGPDEDPEMKCFPSGVPRIYLHRYPVEVLQLPGRVVLHYEYDHFVRQIWTDGRKHPGEAELDSTWMGHSIGSWDGETFVVDTIGLNDKSWLDNAGHPHSDALHIVERIRRPDHDTLQIDFTFDDPKAYTTSWTGQKFFRLRPGWEISEQVCADNFLWKEPGK